MSLIRARQRVVTGINPHNANRRFIIPSRSLGVVEPPEPPVYDYAMTIGFDNTVVYGYSVAGPAIGALVPDTTPTGVPITALYSWSASDLSLLFSVDPGTVPTVTVEIEGLPGSVVFSESAANQYDAVNAGLAAHFEANVGLTLGVNLIGLPEAPALGPNLVLNGGFDTDLIGWEGSSGTRTWVAGGKMRIEPTGGRIVLQNTEATNGPVGGGVYAAGDYEFHLLGVDNQLGVPLNLDIYDEGWGSLYTDNAITLTDTVIPMTFTESHAGLVIYLNSVGTTAANFIEMDAVEVRAKL